MVFSTFLKHAISSISFWWIGYCVFDVVEHFFDKQTRSSKLHGPPKVSSAKLTKPAVHHHHNQQETSNDHQTLRSRAPRHQASNVNQRHATMMIKIDCLLSHAVDCVLQPFMRSARQCLMTRTETTFDQDRRTEGNCACMYTVLCRVIVDNKCEFQHSSSHGDCNFDARSLRAKRGSTNKITFLRFVRMAFGHRLKFHAQKKRTRSHLAECESLKTRQFCQPRLVQPIQCVNSVKCVSFNSSRASKRPTALVYAHSQVLRYVRIHRIRHRADVATSSNRKGAISQCLLGYSLHIACFSLAVMVHPSVRSAQLFHRSNGSTQLLHPFRCSQAILTLVCFCFLFCTSDVGSIQQSCDPWFIM